MTKRRIQALQALLLLALLCGVSLLASPSAHANASAKAVALLNLNNCYETWVTLHGTQPATFACHIPGKQVNGREVPAAPNAYLDSCGDWINADFMMRSTTNGTVCVGNWGDLYFTFHNVVEEDGWADINPSTGYFDSPDIGRYYFQNWQQVNQRAITITHVYIDA